MKMLTFCLTIILITTFTSLVLCETTPSVQLQGASLALDLPVSGKIFYKDPENNILLIDFKEVQGKLSKVQVMKKTQILMEDKVGDLAEDSIYEVDLNKYAKGEYIITLVKENEEKIEEPFIIK